MDISNKIGDLQLVNTKCSKISALNIAKNHTIDELCFLCKMLNHLYINDLDKFNMFVNNGCKEKIEALKKEAKNNFEKINKNVYEKIMHFINILEYMIETKDFETFFKENNLNEFNLEKHKKNLKLQLQADIENTFFSKNIPNIVEKILFWK